VYNKKKLPGHQKADGSVHVAPLEIREVDNLKLVPVQVEDVRGRRQIVYNNLHCGGILGNVDNVGVLGAAKSLGVQQGRRGLVVRVRLGPVRR
jgi:hypothetical protein